LRNIEVSFFELGISNGAVDSDIQMVKMEYCANGMGISTTGNDIENCFFANNDFDVMINSGGHLGTRFNHCWFNNASQTHIAFWTGNETEISFTGCWFEQSDEGIIGYNTNASLPVYYTAIMFKVLAFDLCKFHTDKASDYMFNFTLATYGQISIHRCTFDKVDGTITSIALPTGNATITVEECVQYEEVGGENVTVAYPSTRNSGNATISSSTSVVVTHGLITTPTSATVTMGTTGAGDYYVDTFTTTQFTVHVANSGNYTVYWNAEYNPN